MRAAALRSFPRLESRRTDCGLAKASCLGAAGLGSSATTSSSSSPELLSDELPGGGGLDAAERFLRSVDGLRCRLVVVAVAVPLPNGRVGAVAKELDRERFFLGVGVITSAWES